MKLSEAMILGSVTGKAKVDGDWSCCALGVSAHVAGAKLVDTWSILDEIERLWPWLEPPSAGFVSYLFQISNKFEYQGWSMTQLAEWIKTIEPECGVCNRFECLCHAKEAAPAVLEPALYA